MSSGEISALRRALVTVAPSARKLQVQFIVVRADSQRAIDRLRAELAPVEVVYAPPGSTRSEMCDRAMKVVRGDVISLRADYSIHDADWIADLPVTTVSVGDESRPLVVHPNADIVEPAQPERSIPDRARVSVSLAPDPRPGPSTRVSALGL